jgi:hypothetical protein
MVAKKKEKGAKKKLTLKKETMRDLDAKGSGRHVKAGRALPSITCLPACAPSDGCATVTCFCWK